MPYALFQPHSPFRSQNSPHLFAPPKPRYTTDDWAVAQVFHSYGWIVLSSDKTCVSSTSPSYNDEDAYDDEEEEWVQEGENIPNLVEYETDHEPEPEPETGSGSQNDSEDETDTHTLVDGDEEPDLNDTGSSDDEAANEEAGSSITRYASILELHHTGITLEESVFQGEQVEDWVKWNIMWMADWKADREVDLRYVD